MTFKTLYVVPASGVNFSVMADSVYFSKDMLDIPYWLKTEITEWSVAYDSDDVDFIRHSKEGTALAHKIAHYLPDVNIFAYDFEHDEYKQINKGTV